jgi:hypothetical protein
MTDQQGRAQADAGVTGRGTGRGTTALVARGCAALLLAGGALTACSTTSPSSSAAGAAASRSASGAASSQPASTPTASGSGTPGANASPTPAPAATGSATPTRAGDQSPVLSSLPGSAKSGCVAVGKRTDVRSGSMAAGNFETARKQFTDQAGSVPAPTVNLYLIPADARSLSKVTLTLEQVGGQHLKRSVTSTSVQDAEQWKYFSVQTSVPAAGTWRLRATSGASTGCFEVTFG